MSTTSNTSTSNSTTTNSGNASTNNIIDALIYTGIKNNLTKSNYPQYEIMLGKIGSADDQENLNRILENTTIKKACCAAKLPLGVNDKYETYIHVFDPSGQPYIKKRILVNKSMCEDYKIYNSQKSCEDFRTLYCENSNYLFNKDQKKEAWMTFSDYCTGYTMLQPPKTEAQIATEKKQQDQLSALKDQYASKALGTPPPPASKTTSSTTPPGTTSSTPGTTPSTTKTDDSSTPKTPPTIIDKYNAMTPPPSSESPVPAPAPPPKNNNMLLIGGVVVCCCCIIIIIAIIFMTKKKGKKGASGKSSIKSDD